MVDESTLQFDGSSNQACFDVGITDDSTYEELEEFFLITLANPPPQVQLTQPTTLTVVIQDDDGKELQPIFTFHPPVISLRLSLLFVVQRSPWSLK